MPSDGTRVSLHSAHCACSFFIFNVHNMRVCYNRYVLHSKMYIILLREGGTEQAIGGRSRHNNLSLVAMDRWTVCNNDRVSSSTGVNNNTATLCTRLFTTYSYYIPMRIAPTLPPRGTYLVHYDDDHARSNKTNTRMRKPTMIVIAPHRTTRIES